MPVKIIIRNKDTKRCPRCKKEKPVSDFGSRTAVRRNGKVAHYLVGYCRPCVSDNSKQHRHGKSSNKPKLPK